MPVDHIRYDLLTQDAMRGVIRTVLADAAEKGLPGEHHFFITFDTRAEGVRLSPRLKASYPEDMTIVLQHQFWDLTVGEADFEVGLAFNGVPERLHIPLKAVKGFFDPSVQFGLQFTVEAEGESGEAPALKESAKPQLPVASKSDSRKPRQRGKKDETAAEASPEAVKTPAKPAEGQAPSSGEVVRLDRFRKK